MVTHPGLEGIAPRLNVLARIFRRRQRITASGGPLVPVNLPVKHPLRRLLSRKLFHRDPEGMRAFWDRQYFHGILPPPVLGSQEAVLRFVQRTPGALGYVARCRVDSRVRVLMVLPLTGLSDRDYARLCRRP
ncbi:MAG: hypothetical protein D6721_04755 [Gammaproteobacteria bacterium]|nr:MAG: hypothetical protein D6721_04755 [Gammaproteobacteria bacterium]